MNGNRGQYTSAPLYNIKKRRNMPAPVPQAEQPNGPAQPPQPPQQPQQPGQRRYFALSLIMCVCLPLLFLAALIIPNNLLRFVFVGAAAGCILVMWLLNAFARTARGTLTVIYAALALVIGLALFMNSQNPETRNVSASRADGASAFSNQDPSAFGAVLANLSTPEPEENSNSAAAAAAISAAQQQLDGFMAAWAMGNVPQMLEYVLPSWKTQQSSPDTALWQLTLDSRPIEYQVENVLGSDGDTSRTIVIKVTMNERNTGSEPVRKRMHVIMFKGGQTWYVDPNSLNGVIVDEAAESAANSRPNIGTTIAPTATPAPETPTSGITLYYNKDGKGKYYHTSATCEAVSQQWWPLTSFSYDQLNSAEFSKLLPCPKCNPPARPSVN
ncbi:MAG: hypothetical protein IJ189_06205 [Clostridia bacterium]|nr:hypothetical protein [Clostridia bacterium]